jgi:hypothetical protein
MYELSKRDELLSIISDFHKDARGFRPSLERYENMTESQLEDEVRHLAVEVEQAMDMEAQREQVALREVQKTVAINILSGAANTREGIRWMLQGERFVHPLDVEGFVYSLGILYTVYGRNFLRIAQDLVAEQMAAEDELVIQYEEYELDRYALEAA